MYKASDFAAGESVGLEIQPSQKPLPMKKVLFLALAAASFSLASCESKKEEATEQAAENVEASGEAKADAMEEKADEVRDSTANAADQMEEGADTTATK
ncbi:hypothetical protein [Hymenobacter cavernae]|uniref:YtxH domain-containing protein n=1 Tax=Hymenobacter cavernae TaxID=2044852 RepID=A0ABQ1UCN1_9BACT|nr:hypothetical protein [Hymenobacter cavernae]GGF15935.1 hypothetical protein GCM10011383_29100 [Hymenobacter cavernae]